MEKSRWFSFLLAGLLVLTSSVILFLEKFEVSVARMPAPVGEIIEVHNELQRRMAERTARIKQVCLREEVFTQTNAATAMTEAREMTEVLEDHRLLVCVVHKAGSSTWNTITALRYHREDLIKSGAMYKMINVLKPNWKTYNFVLHSSSYIKVLMARNPFDRVLSAFRNRIVAPGLISFQAQKYVPLVLQHNRGRRFSNSDIFHSDGRLKIFPTFSEFVNYLVVISPYLYDPHWKPVFIQCGVCHIDYDAVLMTETFSEDLQYVMRISSFDEELVSSLASLKVNKADVDTRQILGSYYSTLKAEVLQKFITIFQLDFELFNYNSSVIFDYISESGTNHSNFGSAY